MKKYVFLDIENPNCRNNSICSIGLVIVEGNEILEKLYTLINPEDRFDNINSRITGIENSMVQDSPTLKEYWGKIKVLFEKSIIVGHNVEYDLSVLSKALDRYNIIPPKFKYICTYKLSKQYLESNSYKLEDLCNSIGYKYLAHNALEDALASFELFKFISKDNVINNYQLYDYINFEVENIDSRLESNINDLYGIIKGITYDEIIREEEITLMKKWIEDNNKYKIYSLFNKIIIQLSKIIDDNIIDNYEKIMLLSMIQSINDSKIYSESTLALQILQGILKGIIADELINEKEIRNLEKWLINNSFLSDIYPYDKVYKIVENVLDDGIITNEEENKLKLTFEEILNPYSNQFSIELDGMIYCLTGEFKNGTKTDINNILKNYGAIEKSGVTSKTDYLFVGSLGSDAWKYGNIGGKIAKAQELKEKGSKIEIISEDELFNIINNDEFCANV